METEIENAVYALDDNAPKKTFVVVVDTQYDFMMGDGALYVSGAEQTVLPINFFLKALKPEETAGVLFTYDTHYEDTYDSSEEAKQFPKHCIRDTAGWGNIFNPEIIDPKIEVVKLYKGVFNMWEEANIDIRDLTGRPLAIEGGRDEFFTAIKDAGVDTVVLVGVAADFCVKWAADGFLARGFNVESPRRYTAGIVRNIDEVVQEDYEGKSIRVTLG